MAGIERDIAQEFDLIAGLEEGFHFKSQEGRHALMISFIIENVEEISRRLHAAEPQARP